VREFADKWLDTGKDATWSVSSDFIYAAQLEVESAAPAFGAQERNVRVFLVGYIRYADGNGIERQMGFIRQLDATNNRWYAPRDSSDYEYSY
jgi:hypothetical protein